MKLFNWSDPDPVELAERQVARAKEKHGGLVVQLSDATRELEQAKQAAVNDCMELGHMDAEGSNAIASLAASVETLQQAVSRAALALQEANATHGSCVDAEYRAKSIATINNIIEDVDGKQQAFLSALTAYITAIKPAATINLDAQSLHAFLETASIEVPPAAAAMRASLEHQARSIELQSISPRLPSAEQTPAPKAGVESRPATKTVTLMYSAKWTDPRSGFMRFGSRGWEAELEAATAERCVANGVAVYEYDEQANKLRRERGGPPIADSTAISLDDPNVAPPPRPPERWLRPGGTPKWQPPTQTQAPLTGWTGTSAWIKQSTTTTEGY